MATTTILVILSTIILTVLVWFLISVKLKLWLKFLVVTFCLTLGIPLWFTATDLKGWATENELPDKYQLLWAEVIEPIQSKDDAGLYILVREIEDEKSFTDDFILHSISPTEPRLFRLSYTKGEHQELETLLEAIKGGETVLLEKKGKGGEGGEGGEGNGEKGEGEGTEGRNGRDGEDGLNSGGDMESRSRLGYRFSIPLPKKTRQ